MKRSLNFNKEYTTNQESPSSLQLDVELSTSPGSSSMATSIGIFLLIIKIHNLLYR